MSDPINGASLVFDLDGTLADTAPDLIRALNATIARDGLPEIPGDLVRHMVGRGALVLIQRAYEHHGRTLWDADAEAHRQVFIEVYAEAICVETRLFDGVEATLETLARRGARLSIATNKPQGLSEALIEALGMGPRFERIVGADAAPKKKPDRAHIEAAAGPDAGPIVVIGDSETDYLAARNANAPIILMRYGYSDKPVEALGADALLDRFDALPDTIARLVTERA